MQLISKFNKGSHFLLCVINVYSKYTWVFTLKDKKGITVTKAFQKILDASGRKPNKIWVEKASEVYHRSVKSWLQDNHMEMYSTNNEEKYVVAERCIINNKIYKYMTSTSKNVYIDKLAGIVNKHSNICHSAIKMKPVDVKQGNILFLIKKIIK